MLAQMVRFGGVGGLATLAHVIGALAAERILQLSPQPANLAGFLTAVLVSYFGHSHFTFRSGRGSSDRILRFVLVAVAGYATSSLTVAVGTQVLGLPFAMAMVAVAVIVPASSFLAMRFWVFGANSTSVPGFLPEIALCAALSAALALVFWDRLSNHDIAWYLFATRDWLAGAELYKDLIEVNPPLYFYLTVPGLLLADALGISDANGHTLGVALFLFASLLWSARILQADFPWSARQRLLLVVGIALATTIPALNGLGQREQILVLALLPWALREAAPRPAAARQRIAASVMAAVGMCLKPHFVLLPLAVTLLNCLEQRSLRPVVALTNWVFLTVGLAYIGFVALVHPAYLAEIVPIAVEVYGAYGMPFWAVLFRIGFAMVPLAVLLVLLVRSGQATRPIRVFLALALGGLLSYLMQGTGFDYHRVPVVSFGAIACLMVLLRPQRLRAESAMAALALLASLAAGVQQGFYRNGAVSMIRSVVDRFGPVHSLTTLGSHVYTGAPLALDVGADWASSYPADWLVPGAVNKLARTDCTTEAALCARLRQIADRNRADRIADLLERRPDTLIVDRDSGYFDAPGFDWLGFMAEDPAWAAAFAPYRLVAQNRRFLIFLRQH